MALHLFRDWYRDQLLDQHFGMGLKSDDLLSSLTFPTRPSLQSYFRPWRLPSQDAGSTIKFDKDKFQASLDVQHFSPEEITVKAVDGSIVVEGKHDEKKDEHGYISRNFVRKYILPEGHDIENVSSTLSSDGILTITAPKLALKNSEEKVIPITQTGPVKAVKEAEKKEE